MEHVGDATDLILLPMTEWTTQFRFIAKLDYGIFFGIIFFMLATGGLWLMYASKIKAKEKELDGSKKAEDSNDRIDIISMITVVGIKMEPFIALSGYFGILFFFGAMVFGGINDTSYFFYFRTLPTYKMPNTGIVFQPSNILDFLINFTVLGSVIVLTGFMQKVEARIFGGQMVATVLFTMLFVAQKMFYYSNLFWWFWVFVGAFVAACIPFVSVVWSGLKEQTTLRERLFWTNILACLFFGVWWGVVGSISQCFFFVYESWEQMLMIELILSLVSTGIWIVFIFVVYESSSDDFKIQIFNNIMELKSKLKAEKGEKSSFNAKESSKAAYNRFNPQKVGRTKTS